MIWHNAEITTEFGNYTLRGVFTHPLEHPNNVIEIFAIQDGKDDKLLWSANPSIGRDADFDADDIFVKYASKIKKCERMMLTFLKAGKILE